MILSSCSGNTRASSYCFETCTGDADSDTQSASDKALLLGKVRRFADSDEVFFEVILPLYTCENFPNVAVSTLSIERKFGNFI